MTTIHKDYARPFVLEATKLTRLLGVVHDCLGSHGLPVGKDHFEVFLRGNRVEEATTLEEVIALENSRRHAIVRLLLIFSASMQGEARPQHEVQVDFDSRSVSQSASSATSKTTKITVSVRTPGWAGRTLSNVEEQVDRTCLQDIGVLLFLPLSVVVATALYLLVVCYPNALFLWGDSVGRYETLKQTRTLLWSVIIGTTVVAVLTNAFKEGLTSLLSRQ